jgi:4-hydroxy-tetrahydrodipicolinate synthase
MKTSIRNLIRGPIFSIITPFNKNQSIDYISLKKYILYLYKNGARVFYLMVYNSRFGLLDENEIIKLNLFCIKVVKNLDKQNIIITAEPYHCSTNKSIDYINLFEKNGSDVTSVIFGEKFYNEEQIVSHFRKIHKKTRTYLLLHQQLIENGVSGNPSHIFYPIKVLEKISKLKRFIAMKEDAKNDAFTKKICKKISKDMIIITSGRGKRQWLKAEKYGCQSWLSGVSNLDPKIAIDFYNFYKEKNYKQVNKILEFIEDPFFKIKDMYGWHPTIKACLEINNNFKRYERMPLQSLNKREFLNVKRKFINIKNNSKKLFKNKYFN